MLIVEMMVVEFGLIDIVVVLVMADVEEEETESLKLKRDLRENITS